MGEKGVRKQEVFGQKKPGSVGYNYKITNWDAPPIPLHRKRTDESGKKL
ncbi:hypothetical protein [Wolbachia pipientis]|nr:hypothetical protein [Wolbachia pipientis]